jgi:hypothetical protein
LPDNENAAYLYRAAGNIMDMRVGPDVPGVNAYDAFLMAKIGERAKVVSEKRTSLETWLRDSAIPIELLHEAAQYERAHFDLDFSQGEQMKVPHLAQLRAGARLLMLEAWLAVEEGDSRKALQATWAGFRIRRATQDEPIAIAQLIGFLTDWMAATNLQQIMPLIQPQKEDLLPILRELQSRKSNSFLMIAEALRASRVALMESNRISPLPPGQHSRILEAALGALVRILNGRLPDEAFSLAYMNQFVKGASKLDSMTVADMQRFDEEQSKELTALRPMFLFHELSLTRVLLFSPTGRPYKEDIARRDVTICGVAAELYRIDHGTYPTSLDGLVPTYLTEAPKDTFSGKPLVFKPLANGVLIYSVGPNGKDDGGVDNQQGWTGAWWAGASSGGASDDIAWRVERPAAGTAKH